MRRRNAKSTDTNSTRATAQTVSYADLKVDDRHERTPLLAGDNSGDWGEPQREPRVYPASSASVRRPPATTGTTACAWLASCCGWGNKVAMVQSYADFAEAEELLVVDRLKSVATERCEFTNPEHEALLDSLRQKLRPESTSENFDWRTLGFQSANCRTDFRGCGLTGLRCLHFLADHYPHEFQSYLAIETQEQRGTVSYPVCASALAMVLVLVYRLQLSARPPVTSPDCGTDIRNPSPHDRDDLHTFLQLLKQSNGNVESVFQEIFCAAVAMMHKTWTSVPRKEQDILFFNKLTYLPAWTAVETVLLSTAAVNGQLTLREVCARIRAQ